MKINVEFDLTPDEFRRALGLPDVEAFQKNMLDNIQRQMESGAEGYDPMSLMSPFMQQPMMQQGLSQGLSNFGTYQQMMLDMLRHAGNASYSSSGNSSDSSSQGSAGDKGTADKKASAGKKDTASEKGTAGADGGTDSRSSQQDKATNARASRASANSRAKRSESE